MAEVHERNEAVNIPVPLFIDSKMLNDLQWFVDHFREHRGEEVEIADVIYEFIDNVLDIQSIIHSNTGMCIPCTVGR